MVLPGRGNGPLRSPQPTATADTGRPEIVRYAPLVFGAIASLIIGLMRLFIYVCVILIRAFISVIRFTFVMFAALAAAMVGSRQQRAQHQPARAAAERTSRPSPTRIEPPRVAESTPTTVTSSFAPPAQNPTAPVAGWYADPWAAASYRWWDGASWTATTR